mmetsp:Transcript_29138/g.113175  ORF Transcript_29138/g.113175 Transcript_29138/m.113175 type:complete len:223 (-) Transcript_29138:1959-2627(-)|eukprot:CAMPEP_0113958292 /NCGR_PEP_ID=MMETSP0011_2-20120614/3307_1 /TAXON_ID=101924 /ORGANISM="Rhodosorus marinus" /LENGTH=222 /DNA_ID=CAMNT_0000969075 /DNA_START=349 /DNA_END=1017 /DNA_ORIENTATION=+ /assembly_acc=CAM_ASM_000156
MEEEDTDEIERALELRLKGGLDDSDVDRVPEISVVKRSDREKRKTRTRRRVGRHAKETVRKERTLAKRRATPGEDEEAGRFETTEHHEEDETEERQQEGDSRDPIVVDGTVDPFEMPASLRTRRSADSGARGETDGKTEVDFVRESQAEVEFLGSMQFTGKKKTAWELNKVRLLGARKGKSQKMPLTMLTGMRKTAKARKRKEKEELRAGGMLPKKRKGRRR